MAGEILVADRVTSIINSADLPPAEHADLLRVLTHYAMACYVATPDHDGAATEPTPEATEARDSTRFGDIVDPRHFLGYEHISDFQEIHAVEFPSFMIISRTFGGVVYPRKPPVLGTGGGRSPGQRIDDPETIGLIVKTRDQVGFPRLPRSITKNSNPDVVQRVVQAGSVIMFAGLLRTPSFREGINYMSNPNHLEPRAVQTMAADLTRQIDQARAVA